MSYLCNLYTFLPYINNDIEPYLNCFYNFYVIHFVTLSSSYEDKNNEEFNLLKLSTFIEDALKRLR